MSKKLNKLDTDETLHVFDSHSYNSIGMIELEDYGDYTREELIAAIEESKEGLANFRNLWLLPILDELDYRREDG